MAPQVNPLPDSAPVLPCRLSPLAPQQCCIALPVCCLRVCFALSRLPCMLLPALTGTLGALQGAPCTRADAFEENAMADASAVLVMA